MVMQKKQIASTLLKCQPVKGKGRMKSSTLYSAGKSRFTEATASQGRPVWEGSAEVRKPERDVLGVGLWWVRPKEPFSGAHTPLGETGPACTRILLRKPAYLGPQAACRIPNASSLSGELRLLAREHLTHPDSPQDWASFQTALVMTEPHVYSPDGALEHFESERKLLCTHLTGRKRWER